MGGSTAFVYGTLMAPEVVQTLIKRVPPMKPAVLQGYSRFRVKGVVFPAIVPDPGSVVQGKVLLDLTAIEVDILDAYESVEYYRQTVTPLLEDGVQVTAEVYVWKDEFRQLLLPEAWDYEEWRQKHLPKWCSELTATGPHPDGTLDD